MTGQGSHYRRDGRLVTPRVRAGRSSGVRGSGIVLLPSRRRTNGIGISPELPQWRSVVWNLVFVGIEVSMACWAHFLVGVTWTTLGVGFTAVAVLGVALVAWEVRVSTPRAIRRHQELLRSYTTARHAAGASEANPGSTVEVVDRQPTPHPTAPSSAPAFTSTTGTAPGASRTSRAR